MESTSSRINVPNSIKPSKRLLFDRRYGWVIDEWKEPADEALDGGRGMFCIFPLAKALVQMASQSMLQGALDDSVQNFMTSLKNTGCKVSMLNKYSQSHASNSSSHSLTESNE